MNEPTNIAHKYRIGELDQRVQILGPTETQGTNGEFTLTWGSYGTFWAQVTPAGGSEQIISDMLQPVSRARFVFRYDAAVTEKFRLVWNGHTYNITSIEVVPRNRFLVIFGESMSLSGTPATEFGDLVIDYAKIRVDEITYNDTYWNDLNINVGIFEFAGNADPVLVNWDVGGSGLTIKAYEFAKNDEIYFKIQVPHMIKVGSDLYCHLHWTPGTRGNEESGNKVGWKVQFLLANIGSAFPATVYTADLSDACTGTDHLHEITPDILVELTETINISAFIVGKIYRSDTGTDDTWAGTVSGQLPLLLGMDFHYEMDTPGSKEHSSK